ncbi:hypothetical protein [Parabacteroides chinchillae]
MKAYQREIIVCIVVVMATILAVWFFFGTMEEEKTAVQTDLYSLIAPEPNALLAVNKPAVLTNVILKHQQLHDIFSSYLPDIYLSILQKTPSMPSTLFSFHSQGIVMYTHADGGFDLLIEKEVLKPLLGIYSPQKTVKDGITFTYYPESGRQFFGYYQHQGVFVASYSKKLLESVAQQQIKNKRSITKELDKTQQLADIHAPLNLIVPANKLDLYVNFNDSLQWRIHDKWLLADVFTNEGKVCCFGSQPYFASLDTLYNQMADTLSKRIETVFPQLHITPEIYHDDNMVYYTGCSPM